MSDDYKYTVFVEVLPRITPKKAFVELDGADIPGRPGYLVAYDTLPRCLLLRLAALNALDVRDAEGIGTKFKTAYFSQYDPDYDDDAPPNVDNCCVIVSEADFAAIQNWLLHHGEAMDIESARAVCEREAHDT